MRRCRERRRAGLRSIAFDIRDTEIKALVALGYLAREAANDSDEIAAGLGRLLDRVLA
jgi:hypothetical protein